MRMAKVLVSRWRNHKVRPRWEKESAAFLKAFSNFLSVCDRPRTRNGPNQVQAPRWQVHTHNGARLPQTRTRAPYCMWEADWKHTPEMRATVNHCLEARAPLAQSSRKDTHREKTRSPRRWANESARRCTFVRTQGRRLMIAHAHARVINLRARA